MTAPVNYTARALTAILEAHGELLTEVDQACRQASEAPFSLPPYLLLSQERTIVLHNHMTLIQLRDQALTKEIS